jgi:hypothetical protein
MNGSTVSNRVRLAAVGISVVAFTLVAPSMVARADVRDRCCEGTPAAGFTQPEDPYLFRQPNPLGLRSLASPEQNAEEGELHRDPAEIVAEVGAGEHDVLTTPAAATQRTSSGGWMEQAVITAVVLAALGVSLGLVFMPGDRIPRIGNRRSPSDG